MEGEHWLVNWGAKVELQRWRQSSSRILSHKFRPLHLQGVAYRIHVICHVHMTSRGSSAFHVGGRRGDRGSRRLHDEIGLHLSLGGRLRLADAEHAKAANLCDARRATLLAGEAQRRSREFCAAHETVPRRRTERPHGSRGESTGRRSVAQRLARTASKRSSSRAGTCVGLTL